MPDRLTALDSSFLHLEDAASHMHVASVTIFEGPPPTYEELLEHIGARLSLVPRYRQKLRFVPFNQGRPVWVDDPHFNLEYHVRATALPPPGSEEQLKNLASRVFSQQLDRTKPLWEIWLVQGLERGEDSPVGCAALRAALEDPPRGRRRRRRRRHHGRAVRHGARARDPARHGRALAPAARADLDAAARRGADRARHPARPRSFAPRAPRCGRRGRSRATASTPLSAVGALARTGLGRPVLARSTSTSARTGATTGCAPT